MPVWTQILLWTAVIAAAVHFLLYAAKNDRVKVIDSDEDFELRYPRVFLYFCVVFLCVAGALAVGLLASGAAALPLLLPAALAAFLVPLLLLAAVWRVFVRPEYIIVRNPLGVKRQVYYKDIRSATLTRRSLTLVTTLKTYHVFPGVTYLEYFLKRLSRNGVKIDRYD